MNPKFLSNPGNLAILAALAAAMSTALGGSAFVAVRFLVTETEPVTIAFLRTVIAATVLGPIALVVIRCWPTPRELFMMCIMGALFFGVMQLILSNAFVYTTSSRGALAFASAPFMTLAIAAVFGIEQPTRRKILGIVVATSGVVVALAEDAGAPPNAWIGDGLVLSGAIITAVYGVWSARALKQQSPLVSIVTGVVPGTVLLWAYAIATGAPAFSPVLSSTGWLAIAYLGIGAAVISYTLWLWALRHTTPTLVAVSLPMNPLMALIWGAVLLDEEVTVTMIIGFILVIAGIAITNWQRRGKVLSR